ncbi:ribonuclease HII [Candidatus Aciduliprofundum boonei]|uniref:Ribonuclease HII n=1 Tax=Aciduliprofundum boonei (strain DSM 19572 / T469) TaxID=439481 RepID=B5ID87_ACIB4|nr:ribonuclease HII [Candidatus Aciduliprofundum boonei]ADD08765.1 ribonuclease HII [Aciduliprofundum boonei T469]EDY35688.1 ribonuclease HII [Aciduliprofundum boonei T469]HII55663.1 ribonuclease HII [Candidatus Aciduliprofundum boonei]
MSCGVDEAGRGPVIGPLVVAGVCGEESKIASLRVKDSKKLSPKRRERLAEEIKKVASKIVVIKIEPEEIDALREKMTLNEIEVELFARVISQLNGDKVYVDAADVNEDRFAEEIKKKLGKDVEIISEHKADSKYPMVSAASIIAKVERDRIINELKKELGEFGSGYPADERTKRFLEKYVKEHNELPPHTRHSWKSAKRAMKKKEQKKLGDF